MIYRSDKETDRQACSNPLALIQLAACAILIGTISGCGPTGSQPDYGDISLIKVKGVITLNGLPAKRAEVRFVNDDLTFSSGVTDDAGAYRLMFDSRTSGITAGSKVVQVYTHRVSSEVAELEPTSLASDSNAEPTVIPACYGQASSKVVVVSEGDALIDVALTSDCQ